MCLSDKVQLRINHLEDMEDSFPQKGIYIITCPLYKGLLEDLCFGRWILSQLKLHLERLKNLRETIEDRQKWGCFLEDVGTLQGMWHDSGSLVSLENFIKKLHKR